MFLFNEAECCCCVEVLRVSPEHSNPVSVQIGELQHQDLFVSVPLVPEGINNSTHQHKRTGDGPCVHTCSRCVPLSLLLRVVQVGLRTPVQTAAVQLSPAPVDPARHHGAMGDVDTLGTARRRRSVRASVHRFQGLTLLTDRQESSSDGGCLLAVEPEVSVYSKLQNVIQDSHRKWMWLIQELLGCFVK